MILGLGTDLVKPARLAKRLRRHPALRERLFAPAEVTYCEQQADPAQHYAGRFAAKEALLKALGCGLRGTLALCDAAVVNDERGAPFFELTGEMQQLVAGQGATRIYLSISHISSAASAVVILEA